ncbi:MAG TPA: hypothetical protein VFF98_08025 [Novosphingobium sp.]|nr:hypothetical protein [Novosphingobium sp.]
MAGAALVLSGGLPASLRAEGLRLAMALPEPLTGGLRALRAAIPDQPDRADLPEPPGLPDETAAQVRVEQHFSIRITPGSPAMPPFVLEEAQQEERPAPTPERDIGRCVAMSNILGVQSGEGNRLLLFMRDQRIISAVLERTCRAHDFYSGFYMQRSPDGMICTGRDKLQSRTGMNCRLKALRMLITVPGRRFP